MIKECLELIFRFILSIVLIMFSLSMLNETSTNFVKFLISLNCLLMLLSLAMVYVRSAKLFARFIKQKRDQNDEHSK